VHDNNLRTALILVVKPQSNRQYYHGFCKRYSLSSFAEAGLLKGQGQGDLSLPALHLCLIAISVASMSGSGLINSHLIAGTGTINIHTENISDYQEVALLRPRNILAGTRIQRC